MWNVKKKKKGCVATNDTPFITRLFILNKF